MVLQAIRERLTGIIAVFIFGILIIPFAFVGVNSYFTSDSVNSVARVNDVDITTAEFTQSFQNYRRRMQSLLGANFDPEQFDQPIVRRQFLDSLIDRELLSQVSLETGLSVDDESLAQAIREISVFQVDGEFNTDVYTARLTAQGSNPQIFENEMRAQMVLDQYPETIASSAIATDLELREFVRLQDQQRAFKAIVVSAQVPAEGPEEAVGGTEAETAEEADTEATEPAAEAVPASADADDDDATQAASAGESGEAIDDAAIQAWYDDHPEDFRSEERVIIEYVELDASTMAQDTAPDEDELRSRFEAQQSRFITPEARLASHILIQVDPQASEVEIETARQQAQALSDQARDGADFAELAREHSQDAGSAAIGGDLDWVEPGFMVNAFEDGLYALTLDQPISAPVQTGFGWHVIQLRDIRPAEGMTFEQAREVLLEEYTAEVQERKFLEQADRLVDLVYEDPTTLNTAGEVLGLPVHEAGPFGREGGDGIASNPDVVSAAFSELVLQQGVVSDPVDLGENHLVMLRVKEYMPEAVMPLDQVRDEVIASIRRDQALQQAKARAEALLAQLNEGADISSLAEGDALELVVSENARRNSPEVPRALLTEVFLLPRPETDAVRHELVTLPDGYAVVQLESVTDGVLSEEEQFQQQNYRRRISNAAANTETLGFLRMLREQSEIEVFEDRL